jgi:hypothetical protein
MNDYETPFVESDQRIEQRRKLPDRRAELRFEPHKELRRKNNGRRAGEIRDLWDKALWDSLEH